MKQTIESDNRIRTSLDMVVEEKKKVDVENLEKLLVSAWEQE